MGLFSELLKESLLKESLGKVRLISEAVLYARLQINGPSHILVRKPMDLNRML